MCSMADISAATRSSANPRSSQAPGASRSYRLSGEPPSNRLRVCPCMRAHLNSTIQDTSVLNRKFAYEFSEADFPNFLQSKQSSVCRKYSRNYQFRTLAASRDQRLAGRRPRLGAARGLGAVGVLRPVVFRIPTLQVFLHLMVSTIPKTHE